MEVTKWSHTSLELWIIINYDLYILGENLQITVLENSPLRDQEESSSQKWEP